MMALKQIFLVFLTLLLSPVPKVSALTVVTNFIGGAAPANTSGGGNLVEIVNAAARIWEAAYSDPGTITISFGWAPVGDAGTHTLVEQGGIPHREIAGIIFFDNSGAVAFYLDPTPNSDEEYRRRTEEYQDLGGGLVNVARVFSSPVGDALGHVDLLSVAIHEIGHALGMSAANSAFMKEGIQGAIRLSGDLPFAGTIIPLATNTAGITSHFDALAVTYGSVMGGIGGDERRIPSALDILANAQVSGFTMLNLDPQQTPPSRVAPSRGVGHSDAAVPAQRSARR
ncbi:MAG: hypothetical protein LAP85_20365 [Acidobacteriia bacterium]|nr:hypothetical protein [Terriglobia bacterium]